MINKRIDEEAIKVYIIRVGIILCIFILISILIGSCEFIDNGFSDKPEVTLELILRRD